MLEERKPAMEGIKEHIRGIQEKAADLEQRIPWHLFLQNLRTRDFLEHLGLKYQESRHRLTSKQFRGLDTADRAHLMKQLMHENRVTEILEGTGGVPTTDPGVSELHGVPPGDEFGSPRGPGEHPCARVCL